MSLLSFHRFLIATAIVFCAGFGVWQVQAFRLNGAGPGALALGALFGLFAIALAVYLVRLRAVLRIDD